MSAAARVAGRLARFARFGGKALRCLAPAAVVGIAGIALAQEGPPDVPAGDARIDGRITHAERADAGAAADVILYSLDPAGEAGLRRVRADAAGRFRFEGIASDPAVVYLVGTRVGGVPFGARVSFAAGERAREVEISVSDPTLDVSQVATLEPQLRLERGCTHLRVRHRHPLRNDSGGVVYVPPEARADAGATPLLELLLPEGASEIETSLGGGEGFERDGRRLRYWGPLYPGESGVEFGYGLALTRTDAVRIGFPGGAPSLVVFSPADGARVSGEGLSDDGERMLANGLHRAMRAAAVAPGGEIQLAIALDAVPDTSGLSLSEARIWLELDDAAIDVSELYQLRVEGDTALESRSDAPLLCVPLPEQASSLRFSNASLDLGLSRDPDGGLALHGPLPPGESSLSLRYQLPANPGTVRFSRDFGQAVPLLTLLVADTGLVPTTGRLHPRRPMRTEDRSYLHLEGFGIEAGEEVLVDLAPLQERRPLPSLASSGFVLLAALSTLFFLIGPLRSTGEAIVTAEPETISTERRAVYQAIEALDEDFETGKLTPEDHERMRGELRARAVTLLRAERRAAAEKPPSPEPAAPAAAAAAPSCPACGAGVSADDRFCSQCGGALESEAGA